MNNQGDVQQRGNAGNGFGANLAGGFGAGLGVGIGAELIGAWF
jgi:hypothetical protein